MNITIEDEFEIEDLGIIEEWVYDIEVENNHNFFGNNILIHNSVYFTIAPFMEEYMKLNPNLPIDKYVDWADTFESKIVQPAIQNTVDEFAKQLNAYNKSVIKSEREGIFDKIMFSAKKKYIARVRDSEGTRYSEDDPYIKVMGLEIIKGGTPTFSKKYLKEAIPVILDKSESDLRTWIKDIRNRYVATPIYDISPVSTIGNVQYNPSDLNKNGRPKPLTAGTKSALAYNNFIQNNGMTGTYQKISSGDKAKRIYLQMPNKFHSSIISYNTENFTKEIKECIDYDTAFSKTFLKPLQLMVNPLSWNVFKDETDNSDW